MYQASVPRHWLRTMKARKIANFILKVVAISAKVLAFTTIKIYNDKSYALLIN